MRTSLEDLYRDLRGRGWRQFRTWVSVHGPSEKLPPKGVDFSAEPLSRLDHAWFREFWDHPQVSALVADAIADVLLGGEDGARPPLLDAACNWCVEALQAYSEPGDDVAEAFRQFWALLMLPPPSLRKEKPSKSEEALYSYSLFVQQFEREAAREAVEKKLSWEVRPALIPLNPAYAEICRSYCKRLRACNQKGFIYLLGEFDFNDFYIPPQLLSSRMGLTSFRGIPARQSTKAAGWKHIFDRNGILYVIGVPGSGKSLFLRNIMNHYEEMSFADSGDYLIVYCDMKTYYTNGNSNQKSIPDFLQETMINATGMEKDDLSIEFVRYYLRLGRCLVLMDALDEIPKATRLELHKKVVSYFREANPNNKVCITSRARGFLPQEKIEVLRISELTSQDISDYLDKMIALDRFKAKDKDTFLKQASVLVEKDFLTNFLVLSLMVNIYKAERELPENKVDLYKKCFEYIAKKREMEKGSRISYDWDLIAPLMKESTFISLSTLAAPNNTGILRQRIEEMLLAQYRYKYVDEAKTESAIRQFLEFCSSRTDLFVLADADETFKFFHRSFFEYFYSRYITQQESVSKMYKLMAQFGEDSEVFELTVALIKEENERKYQELIRHMFSQAEKELQQSQPRYAAFKILTLSMQVVDDAYFRREYVRLIVRNAPLMTSPAVGKMNQRQIARRIRQILSASPEDADRFQQAYRDRCISFVMKLVGSPAQKELDAALDWMQTSGDKSPQPAAPREEFRIELRVPPMKHFVSNEPPFYVIAYPQADALRDMVVGWEEKEFEQFLSTLPGDKGRRQIQLGAERFQLCSRRDREALWTLCAEGTLSYLQKFGLNSVGFNHQASTSFET